MGYQKKSDARNNSRPGGHQWQMTSHQQLLVVTPWQLGIQLIALASYTATVGGPKKLSLVTTGIHLCRLAGDRGPELASSTGSLGTVQTQRASVPEKCKHAPHVPEPTPQQRHSAYQ